MSCNGASAKSPSVSMTANTYLAVSVLFREKIVIVAFVCVMPALTRPRKFPRITIDDGEASTKAKRDPLTATSTRRIVLTTLNVHSSVRGCLSKTRNGLAGCDVMVTSCDSIRTEKKIVILANK